MHTQLFQVNPIHFAVKRFGVGSLGHLRRGPSRLFQPNHRQPVLADEGDRVAVGRKLGIVARSRPSHANLSARAAAQIIEPRTAILVEEQARRVRRPNVAGHPVAVAMVAVRL